MPLNYVKEKCCKSHLHTNTIKCQQPATICSLDVMKMTGVQTERQNGEDAGFERGMLVFEFLQKLQTCDFHVSFKV